jgi:outer membrane immunogenic protein
VKKLTLAVLLASTSLASAADFPLKAAPYIATYDWSGFYVGGHVGGGWGTNDISDPGLGIIGTLLNVPVVQTTKSGGFLGGVQGGVNYQFGKFVIGTEADFSWANINGTSTSAFSPNGAPPGLFSRSLSANTDFIGTTTTRLGIANNNWLFYGKAGVAFDNTNYADAWTITTQRGVTPLFIGGGSSTRLGWTVGSGVEWAIAGPLSVKLEYDYMNFGQKTETVAGNILPTSVRPIPANFGVLNSQSISEVKFGVNYRFMPTIW